MRPLSFHQRLLFGVLLLIGSTTMALLFVGTHMGANFLRTRFEDRMAFLARYLALNAEVGILIGDEDMLKRLAKNLLSEKDVIRVRIEDAKGQVLVDEGPKTSRSANEAVAEVRLKQIEEDQAFLGSTPQNQYLGRVHVIYGTSGIDELLSGLLARYVVVTLLLAVVGLLAFSVFSRSLVAPLKGLVKATRKVAGGSLDAQVEGGSLPETRELSEAFNHMLVSLGESRKALEETYQEMVQQKALAEVGHFALTVAHEVKNPLGIIKGSLDILKKDEVPAEMKATMIHYVEDEVLRLNRLIQDFLDFARPRKPRFDTIDCNSILSEVAQKMKLEWEPKGVRIVSDIPPTPCLARADSDLLAQAFVNIVKNGCEAVGREGVVRISTQTHPTHWIAEIADNGCGMDEAARRQAFRPFFTTKAKGSGLGLAFAAQVMDTHGGEIQIQDNPPKGTVFALRLSRPMG